MKKEDRKIWLLALILIVITLAILLSIIKQNKDRDNLWKNYDEFNYADAFLKASKVSDRTIYWSLEDIVSKFISSYVTEDIYSDESVNAVGYEDYYNALSEDYKKFLSKDEYLEKASVFLSKFMVENDYEGGAYMESSGLIDSVYLIEESIYLCNLTSKLNKTTGYIVIGLNEENKSFNIMYME